MEEDSRNKPITRRLLPQAEEPPHFYLSPSSLTLFHNRRLPALSFPPTAADPPSSPHRPPHPNHPPLDQGHRDGAPPTGRVDRDGRGRRGRERIHLNPRVAQRHFQPYWGPRGGRRRAGRDNAGGHPVTF
jgi:hypothetical protein